MRTAPLVLVASLVGLAACSSAATDDSDGQAATESPLSYIGKNVQDVLETKHAAMRGKTWDLGKDNALDSGWILQTPLAEYWGRRGEDYPVTTSCDGEERCDRDYGL